LAVRLMSGQRMSKRYGRLPAFSSNGLQQCVSRLGGNWSKRKGTADQATPSFE